MVFGNRHQDFLEIDGLIFEQLVLRKKGQGAEVQIAVDQLLLEPVGDVLDDIDFDFGILGQKRREQTREVMLAVKRGDSKADGLLLGRLGDLDLFLHSLIDLQNPAAVLQKNFSGGSDAHGMPHPAE